MLRRDERSLEMNNLPILLLFLSIIVTTFNRGFFSFPALVIVLSILAILVKLFLKSPKTVFKISPSFLQMLFVVIYSLFMFFSGGIYQSDNLASYLLYFLPLVSFPLVLTYILDFRNFSSQILKYRFYFLLLLALSVRILIIIASPRPVIDVFTILKEAPLSFLSGQNPYDTVYSPVYPGVVTDYYPYWPASFILQIPFILLFGDPRILLFLADILSAAGLYFLGKKSQLSQLLVLIYLFRPNSNFILEQSWTTLLPLLLIILSIIIWENRRELLLGVVLGVMTALQPIYAIFLPFYLILMKGRQRTVLGFLITVAIFVVPFFLWNPGKFLDKTIFVYFKPASLVPTIPVHLSLNLSTAFYTFTGWDTPNLLSISFLFIISIIIFYRLWLMKKQTADIKQLLLGITIFFYAFYLLFRQAFINYYYFASGLLILWLVSMSRKNKNI